MLITIKVHKNTRFQQAFQLHRPNWPYRFSGGSSHFPLPDGVRSTLFTAFPVEAACPGASRQNAYLLPFRYRFCSDPVLGVEPLQ